MESLILTLLLSGIVAGLIQYFVDFRMLPIYTPAANTNETVFAQGKDGFWRSLLNFLKRNWQFFGYLTVGIAGAFLVPVIDQLLHLRGVQDFLNCIGQKAAGVCKNKDWNLLVIFGYGIISGYSSVRIIRGFGNFITANIGKDLSEQKEALEQAQKEIAELKKKLPAANNNELIQLAVHEELLEGIVGEDFCDASESIEGLEGPPSSCTSFPAPWDGKKWRVAGSLKKLFTQVNALAAGRNKKSDGHIGDIRHQTTDSDHNPWVLDVGKDQGIVTAIDITHDNGKCDCNKLAQSLEANKDKRIKYVIWNSRIMNSSAMNGSPAWSWRPYTGKNRHEKHIHISVHCEKSLCDDEQTWKINLV